MAGIYIHIPFCKQACNYCNFHFSTSRQLKNDFVAALLKEISIQREYLAGEEVETIYFGGGTPSLLDDTDLQGILDAIKSTFLVAGDVEITLEANPDDINPQKLQDWILAGVNRLSIGVQSFFEDDLVWMNRAHNAGQALACIGSAKQAGFTNLSVDLIYGLPGFGDDKWEKNIQEVLSMGIPHLSCYALTVEQKTPLGKLVEKGKMSNINPDDQARQFMLLEDWLANAGYEHYEISNFAKPGKRSRHNTSYWEGKKYLGLGPSAHSYNGFERQWNVSNNALYINGLKENKLVFEKERLTEVQQLNEYIMISLRTQEGCDLLFVRNRFGAGAAEKLIKACDTHCELDNMVYLGEKRTLTRKGRLLADGIASDLFFNKI
jgi:oxygen-independent coproporphyrinogen III oxidase